MWQCNYWLKYFGMGTNSHCDMCCGYDISTASKLWNLSHVEQIVQKSIVWYFYISVDKPLDGQVAIVTGASSGIGAAVSLHLARSGAAVALVARREDKLQEVKKQIEQEGGIAIAVKCDVVDRDEVRLNYMCLNKVQIKGFIFHVLKLGLCFLKA